MASWAGGQTIGLLTGSTVLLALFALVEARAAAPLVPLRVLRSRSFVVGNLVMLLVGVAAFGMSFVVSLYAQNVLGHSALRFGVGTTWRRLTRRAQKLWSP